MDKSHSARLAGALSIGLTAAALPVAAEAQTAAPAPAPKLHVYAQHHVMYGSKAAVKGRLTNGTTHTRVFVQIRSGGRWKTVARTHTRAGGRFRTHWRSNQLGRFGLRALAPASGAQAHTTRGKVIVYRAAAASWYGPGLYGNKL